MALPFSPQPKPTSRLKDKRAQNAENARKARVFRDVVYQRDGGLCRYCARKVFRTLDLCAEQAQVHHLRGRNVAPELKFDPDHAVLTCWECHRKAQLGLLKLPKGSR